MKILIDIGHPAHVHYFKNFIKIMEQKGHELLIISRDKEISFELLKRYNIPYISRGKGGNNLLSKIFYIPKADFFIYKKGKSFRPDILLSFGSSYAAHAAKMLGKPHIALDDTEHAKLEHIMYPPFTDVILNPDCFTKDFGEKQILFKSYIELLYLHRNYFTPDNKVLELLDVQQGEEYAIVRFVSWNASHDVKEKGLSNKEKVDIVKKLSNKMKVFVSSEGDIPKEIEGYQFNVPSEFMHDALYYARLYVGEGGTTASEAAILGAPAVYINRLSMGYIEDEKNAGLLIQTTDAGEIEKSIEYFLNHKTYKEYKQVAADFICDKIDPTKFLVWFVENYPTSFITMRNNPDYQYNFQ
jgi:predicted glycosyltransferase